MPNLTTNICGLIPGDSSPPRLLLLESGQSDADAIARVIDEHVGLGRVVSATTLNDTLRLDLDHIDLALISTDLPDADGVTALEELLLVRPDLPVIMLSKVYDPTEATRAMHEGAFDYLVKTEDYLRTLTTVIEKNLAIHRVKQENARLQAQLTATLGQLRSRNEQLQRLVAELETLAATDALTGIANRRAITRGLDQRFAQATRSGDDLAVIAIDLDGFKRLNDAVGHPAGDRVLMLVARVLSANARASDVSGRLGGDEFIVVLPETSPKKAKKVAMRIQSDFNHAYQDLASKLGYAGPMTLSAGLATRHQADTPNASSLLAAADHALYRAKHAGRACVVVHNNVV